jgi:hypothetical protein
VPIEFIDEHAVGRWVIPDHPLHPAYRLSTPIHRSDYLRTYLMHHHGGGYTDIKHTDQSWVSAFDQLDSRSGWFGTGKPDRPGGIANFYHGPTRWRWASPTYWHYRWVRRHAEQAISPQAFIFRPRTRFTMIWMGRLNRRMDRLMPELLRNPGRHARERPGMVVEGRASETSPLGLLDGRFSAAQLSIPKAPWRRAQTEAPDDPTCLKARLRCQHRLYVNSSKRYRLCRREHRCPRHRLNGSRRGGMVMESGELTGNGWRHVKDLPDGLVRE